MTPDLLPAQMRQRTVVADTGCWDWLGATNHKGYGRVRVGARLMYAHRFAYEAFVGPIPNGLQIDHLCRNRACVNPKHLEPVTALVNNHRGATNANKTHCPRGHDYREHGVVYGGRRHCRPCVNARHRART